MDITRVAYFAEKYLMKRVEFWSNIQLNDAFLTDGGANALEDYKQELENLRDYMKAIGAGD